MYRILNRRRANLSRRLKVRTMNYCKSSLDRFHEVFQLNADTTLALIFVSTITVPEVLDLITIDRAGTRVDPAYQRRGLATMLGQHMNTIVEATRQRLFVCVRPAAVRMCEKDGYQEVAKYEVDLSQFGGHGIDTSVVFVKCFNQDRTP